MIVVFRCIMLALLRIELANNTIALHNSFICKSKPWNIREQDL